MQSACIRTHTAPELLADCPSWYGCGLSRLGKSSGDRGKVRGGHGERVRVRGPLATERADEDAVLIDLLSLVRVRETGGGARDVQGHGRIRDVAVQHVAGAVRARAELAVSRERQPG